MAEKSYKSQITGTDSDDSMTGTNRDDFIVGHDGDDIISGGLGADVIDGGSGNDRIVFTDSIQVDTIHFINDGEHQDIIDLTALLPIDADKVNDSTLHQYVKVNNVGVYIDTRGQGVFTSDTKIARFSSDNPPLNKMSTIQVAVAGTVINYDWTKNADKPLYDSHEYVSDEVSSGTTVRGGNGNDHLMGSDGRDHLIGGSGDDVLEGLNSEDYYDGGIGNDTYILGGSDSVDLIKYISDQDSQDTIDVKKGLPATVTYENIKSYLMITEDGVYLDKSGKSYFDEENKIASFTEDSVYFENSVLVKFNEISTIRFDIFPIGVTLGNGESFLANDVVSDKLQRSQYNNTTNRETEGDVSRAFVRSEEGDKINLKLDEFNLSVVHGGYGDEILDATAVASSDVDNDGVRLYGRLGNDTLKGNDEGGMLDGGDGHDILEAGAGRDLLLGGSGRDVFSLSFDGNVDSSLSDLIYDFKSTDQERDILDFSRVLPVDATLNNIHSFVKVTEQGVYVDLEGRGAFSESDQLVRFGARTELSNTINMRLADGNNILFNRDEALTTVEGSDESERLHGGEGSDVIKGFAGDDELNGDGLTLSQSADHLYGGEGNDKLYVDQLDVSEGTVDGGAGYDEIRIQADEGESVSFDLYASNIEKARGSNSNDTLDGSGYIDATGSYDNKTGEYVAAVAQRLTLYGHGGDDILTGGIARDYLDGGIGNDRLSGGLGKDIITGAIGNDTFVITDISDTDIFWDFTSTDDHRDILDISTLVSNDFDFSRLSDFLHFDETYIYFDENGEGIFLEDQVLAKLGSKSIIGESVDVQLNDVRVNYNLDTEVVFEINEAPVLLAASLQEILFTIDESSPEATSVGVISATDNNDALLVYSLVDNAGGRFAINASTGEITVANSELLDFESASTHVITAQVSDGRLIDTQDYIIALNDINESPTTNDYRVTLNEDATYIFTPLDFQFSDQDENDYLVSVTFHQLPTKGLLLLNGDRVSNDETVLLNDIALGYLSFIPEPDENGETYTEFKFTVSDGANDSEEQICTFDIIPVNDAAIISGEDTGLIIEDEGTTLTVSGTLSIQDSDVGESEFSEELLAGTYGNFTIDGQGSWEYSTNNSESAIQSLGDGKELIDTVEIHSLDGTAHNLVVTIQGTNDQPVLSVNNVEPEVTRGLMGEIYNTNLAINNFVDLGNLLNGSSVAKFHSTELKYSEAETIAGFLGGDADSLDEDVGDHALDSQAIRLTGYIRLPEGEHEFTIKAENCFRMSIDGNVFSELIEAGGAEEITDIFYAPGEGFYEFEMVYWQKGRTPNLEVISSLTNGDPLSTENILYETIVGYVENDDFVLVAEDLMLDEPDQGDIIRSATVTIENGFVDSEDKLLFTDQNGLSGNWDVSTGTLTLSGDASPEDYETALQSVAYRNSSDNLHTEPRTISITVSDGHSSSEPIHRILGITRTNDGPQLINNALDISEGESKTLTSVDLKATDPDHEDGSLMFFIRNVEHGFFEGGMEDETGVISFTQQELIDGLIHFIHDGSEYSPQYDVAVSDGPMLTTVVSANINFTTINDLAIVTLSTQPFAYSQGDESAHIFNSLMLSDDDTEVLRSVTIRVNDNYNSGEDELSFVDQNGISGNWDAQSGVLSLSGEASIEVYQSALQSITYTNHSGSPDTLTRTIDIVVNDGIDDSPIETASVTVADVNIQPLITGVGAAIESLIYTENKVGISQHIQIYGYNQYNPKVGEFVEVTLTNSDDSSESYTIRHKVTDNRTYILPRMVGQEINDSNEIGDEISFAAGPINSGYRNVLQIDDPNSPPFTISTVYKNADGDIVARSSTFMRNTTYINSEGSFNGSGKSGTAQVELLTVPDDLEVGQTVKLNVENIEVSHTILESDSTESIRDSLKSLLESYHDITKAASVQTSGTDGILLTANNPGIPFTASGMSTPENDAYGLSIGEHIGIDEIVGVVAAHDKDGASEVLSFSLLDDAGGRFSIDQWGSIKVVRSLDFEVAQTHTLRVQVSDGELTDVRNVTISVVDMNDRPVLETVDLGSIQENRSVIITQVQLLADATDLEGDELTVIDVSLENVGQGSITNNGDATWTYTPVGDFSGDDIRLEFIVSDGSAGNDITAIAVIDVTEATTEGDDVISAGEGHNILTGAGGADVFFWTEDHLGTIDEPAEDSITDFHTGANGDVLDLSDVLSGEHSNAIDTYLHLNFQNGDTTIEVTPGGNNGVIQKIKLEGIDLSGYGGASSDIEIINNLINDGNLQID